MQFLSHHHDFRISGVGGVKVMAVTESDKASGERVTCFNCFLGVSPPLTWLFSVGLNILALLMIPPPLIRLCFFSLLKPWMTSIGGSDPIRTVSQECSLSEWAELTPLEDCLPMEILLMVEKPLWQDCRLVMDPR